MNSEFLSALKQIEKERNLPLDMLLQAIEDALLAAYKRNFGPNQNVIIEIDRHSGELHIWRRKLVVPEVEDSGLEMSLEEARHHSPDFDIGMEIDLEVPNETFGKIAAKTAKQVIVQRIREAERDIILGEYVRREGELVKGTVQRYEHRNVLVNLGRAEGVIPPNEQAHNEWFRHGDRIKACVMEVKTSARGPKVVLSRAQPGFVKRLFEMEVPEIRQGIIQVKAVVREAGLRSKIAVKSLDPSVDPVGACVGPKGSRVQSVVDELRGEKIDVIPWSDDPSMFVANSLQPARVSRVILNDSDRSATVVVPDEQLSVARGKEGQNARLAARLTDRKIEIKSESEAPEQAELEARPRNASVGGVSVEVQKITESPGSPDGAPGGMRVHELARERGMDSKPLVKKLNDMGTAVKVASSTPPEEVVAKIRDQAKAEQARKDAEATRAREEAEKARASMPVNLAQSPRPEGLAIYLRHPPDLSLPESAVKALRNRWDKLDLKERLTRAVDTADLGLVDSMRRIAVQYPTEAVIPRVLGWVEARLERWEQAALQLHRAASLSDDPRDWLNAAMVGLRAPYRAEAVAALERFFSASVAEEQPEMWSEFLRLTEDLATTRKRLEAHRERPEQDAGRAFVPELVKTGPDGQASIGGGGPVESEPGPAIPSHRGPAREAPGTCSELARLALESCPMEGAQTADQARKRAGDTPLKHAQDRARWWLTAARLERDGGSGTEGFKSDLKKYFRSKGDSELHRGQQSPAGPYYGEVAGTFYGESLRLETKWNRWESSESFLILYRYIQSWFEPAHALRTRRDDAKSAPQFARLACKTPDSIWLAHLAIVCPAAADLVWTAMGGEGDDSRPGWARDIGEFTVWKEKITQDFRNPERAIRYLYDMKFDALEGACPDLLNSPYLRRMDAEQVKRMLEIHERVADFDRLTVFGEQERLAMRILRDCDAMIDSIPVSPTPFAVQAIRPWLKHLRLKVEENFAAILDRTRPVLSLSLAKESHCPDSRGEIVLQLQASNQAGCSPASRVEVEIHASPDYFVEVSTDAAPHPLLSGGDGFIRSTRLRLTAEAREGLVFPLVATVRGQDRTGKSVSSERTSLSVRLYSEDEFEAIHNPYNQYSGGTPVSEPGMLFGRQELLQKLEAMLNASGTHSQSILLYGQKRSGKSTVLSQLKRRLAFPPFLPLEFQLGGDLSIASFLFQIVQKLEFALQDRQDLHPPDLSFPRFEDFKADPEVRFHDLMERFRRACGKTPGWAECVVILMIDEFSHLHGAIESGQIGDSFMKTWKALIERGYFRSVLVGQDFMPRFKQRFPNEFGVTRDERISYLAPEHALELIEQPTRIGNESRFRGRAAQRVLELTAGSPWYLQIFCDRLVDFMNATRAIYCTEADVERVKDGLVWGEQALEADKFDNLVSAGDEKQERKNAVERVLRAVATTQRDGWSKADSIGGLGTANGEILKDLVARAVLESKPGGGYYRIRVGLYQEWLARH